MFDSSLDPLSASRKRKLETGESEEADTEKDKPENGDDQKECRFVTGVPLTTMPGHTGYLTFATLPPII